MAEEQQELLQFQYPVGDDIESLESVIYSDTSSNKLFIKAMIPFIIGTICLFISILIINSLLLFVGGLMAIFVSIGIARQSIFSKHLLEIEAYETLVFFKYFSTSSDEITELALDYSDIKGCFIDTDNYTTVRLVYSLQSENSSSRVIKLSTGELTEQGKSGTIIFRLNPNTPEQAFFLYSANKLFRTNYKQWKIVKHFGTEEDYYEKIYNQTT